MTTRTSTSTSTYTDAQIRAAGREMQRHEPGNGYCLYLLADLSGGAWYAAGDHPAYDRATTIAVRVPEIRAIHHPRSARAYGQYIVRAIRAQIEEAK